MNVLVSVIIISYNTKKLTADAINAVLAQKGVENVEIILVDNNSTDGTVAYLKEKFKSKIIMIAQSTNHGFAQANNVGISKASGKYLLLLNSDTLMLPGALLRFLDVANANPDFGILSPRLLNPDHTYQPQGGQLPTLLNIAAWWLWPLPGLFPGILPYQNLQDPANGTQPIMKTGWVAGTAMLLQRAVVEKIGNLDEHIFMYAEDVDYCVRANRAGFRVGIVWDAEVLHYGSASGSSHHSKVGEIKGLRYVLSKTHSTLHLLLVDLIFVIGALLRYLLFGILKGDTSSRKLYRDIISAVISR
ncbi:glycosyltransferase family 2 protein [Candidatus Woesebacteria bacterium]|nr:glycosyltransferase family 2 protein [Candidatus Woesebacteria bacterium]